tara:strand:+ start:587 stop:1510 length:924 start_codon:yes stop_codon:yes gene_type:complete
MSSQDEIKNLLSKLNKVIFGKKNEIELITTVLLAEGHVLIEDVPGTGKTVLAKAISTALGLGFKRVQMTPDLLPSDLTGSTVMKPDRSGFDFSEGPLFSSVVLADEINRASPKTLSAMLEAMEEKQITVDGTTRILPEPFLVIATQNPVEHEGVFQLPYAQLDRFAAKVTLGYVDQKTEVDILSSQNENHPLEGLKSEVDSKKVQTYIQNARAVHISDPVQKYIVEIVRETRKKNNFIGVSTRGAIVLSRVSRAKAWLNGRDFVLPDDVKNLAIPILAHRMIDETGSFTRGEDEIKEILSRIPAPIA